MRPLRAVLARLRLQPSESTSPSKVATSASGAKSRYSSGCLVRLTQTARRPNATAPATSQRFDEKANGFLLYAKFANRHCVRSPISLVGANYVNR